MTPDDVKAARAALGLSQSQLSRLLGFSVETSPPNARGAPVARIERGAKPIGGAEERLLRAYLDGYRPGDWPTQGGEA